MQHAKAVRSWGTCTIKVLLDTNVLLDPLLGAVMPTYLIVIGRTATGYNAHCPDVPGCAAVGKTVEAVAANMKKALEFHFEGLVQDGEPIPKPGGRASYKEVLKDQSVDEYFLAHVQIETSRFGASATRS
jgi:predicted RNase H-like HicB family nuclease